MKPVRNLRWVAVSVALAPSLNLLLNISLSPVGAQSPPREAISDTASVELAQNSQAVSHFNIIAEADDLYKKGQTQAAENLYRQVKPDFPEPPPPGPQPIYEIEELSPGGQVYWRNIFSGIEKNLESQIFVSLHLLTENYPQFIPGHLKFAEVCQEKPEACEQYAKDSEGKQPKNAVEVLERVTTLYPDDPDLLKAKIEVLADAEQFLEASIAARQYSLIYIDYPEAPEFKNLADEYLKRYEKQSREELIPQIALSCGLNIWKRNWSRKFSGCHVALMLIDGEASFGKKAAEQHKQQLELLEDPEVLKYIQGLGGRFTPYMGRDFEYEYYIVKDSALNAFALPGGKIFVHTGAILGTNSEAELAGLLAHEIAHTALSHGFHRVVQGSLFKSLQETFFRNLGRLTSFSNFLFETAQKEYSREHERQADIFGTKVLAASGYAADGLRNLMVTFAQQQGNAPTSWKSTHPAGVDRVRYLERLIRDNGYNRYAYEGVKKHREIQNRIKGLPPEEDPNPTVIAGTSLQDGGGSGKPNSAPSPSQPTVGDMSLNSQQTRSNVEIKFTGVNVSRTGSFTVKFVIENRSDRPFGFSRTSAEVLDTEGNRVNAKFSLETSDSGDSLVSPGSSRQGEVWVLGQRWNNNGQQNLTLVIKEGTSGGRVFRIGF